MANEHHDSIRFFWDHNAWPPSGITATATGRLAQWRPSNTTWLICFATATGLLEHWPSNTTWLICFATATGWLEQWPSNTTWLIWFATTTGQFDQTSRTVQNKTRSGWCTGSRSGTHFPQARFAGFFSGHKLTLWHCFARRWAALFSWYDMDPVLLLGLLVQPSINLVEFYKTFWAIKVCLLAANHSQIIPFSSTLFNHGRPTCHFIENILVLDSEHVSDFSYSFDWSQVAFGLFPSFSPRLLWRLEKYISTFFLFCTRSVYGRTRNDQEAGKVLKRKQFASNVVKHVANRGLFLQ